MSNIDWGKIPTDTGVDWLKGIEINNGTPDLWSIKIPVYAWKCQMSPNYFRYVEKGSQLNAFHRLMQQLILGFRWERL